MSKSKNNSKSIDNSNQAQDSLLGLFTRIFWTLIGNVVLFFLAIEIYRTKSLISGFDIAFWILVLLLIIVRYIDIKYLKGINAEGLPATMGDWRKYVKYLLIITAGVWVLGHGLSLIKR